MATIYESIGGEAALTAVVDDFYARVLADPELQGFFGSVDLNRLKGRQIEFFGAALGGPMTYSGAPMDTAHSGLGISSAHFAAVAGHLSAALSDAGVPAETVTTILGAISPLADQIITA
ncbi:group I truncated hemoglobin [Actinocorallia lasiicapitis]